MKLLKPGDPCPCCGRPLKDGLSTETVLLLSMLAEKMSAPVPPEGGADGEQKN